MDPGGRSLLSRKVELELRKVARQGERSPCVPWLGAMKTHAASGSVG